MAKVNPKFDFMPRWKDEEKCYEDAKMEGFKDEKTGKKAEDGPGSAIVKSSPSWRIFVV
jgi:hypothetical protein